MYCIVEVRQEEWKTFVVEPDARNPRGDERLNEILESVHKELRRVEHCLRVNF